MKLCTVASALAVAGVATPATADDAHYQNLLAGERAIGMGGAFCALADDPSGSFYNPAGQVFVAGTSVSASLNVYGYERRDVARGHKAVLDGEVIEIDLDDGRLATLPLSAGVVHTLGPRTGDGRRRIAVGFSTFLRSASERSVDAVLQGPQSRAAITVTESDRALWTGPSVAVRVADAWSVGLAVFYASRQVRRERNDASETEAPDCDPPGCPSLELALDEQIARFDAGELVARLGVRYAPSPSWSFGVALTAPSLHVRGSGTLISKRALTLIDPATGLGTAEYDPRVRSGLATRDEHPLSVRVGLAHQKPGQFALAADLSWHAPVRFAPIALPDGADPDTPIVDLVHVGTIDRGQVINLNLGGELELADAIPIRAGVFTNVSAAPEVVAASQSQLADIDMIGLTASIGYRGEDYDLSLGAIYSFGSGTAAAWDPEAGDTGLYVPTDARNDFVYFYVTGARKVATRVAKSALKRLNRRASPNVAQEPEEDP